MIKMLKNSLLTALTLGLMSGSVMAHEEHADASKEPYETGTHKPDPPAGGGGHDSLAGAATNPIHRPVVVAMTASLVPQPTRSQTWFSFRYRMRTPRIAIMYPATPTPSSSSR